ncbi:MAG: gene transfer agent family protein [Parasphingorhabdus sp.]|uniref:gene transfer agent family protein n=1 Tax=Parasphingorhabdus sp. TaxID=2709688 RepID=UPI0032972F07
MSERANAMRGEAELEVAGQRFLLRPSFSALVAAEDELGSLFDLVERAANGRLLLSELAGLFWHVIQDRPQCLTRDKFSEAIVAQGMASMTPALKILLTQILSGR